MNPGRKAIMSRLMNTDTWKVYAAPIRLLQMNGAILM